MMNLKNLSSRVRNQNWKFRRWEFGKMWKMRTLRYGKQENLKVEQLKY